MSTVLVTGGAGYIGSAVVTNLLRGGHAVRVLDNLSHGGNSLLTHSSNPAFDFSHGDIRDQQDVAAALKSVEVVIHLAALVGDPACATDPDLATEINKDGSELLCRAAIEAGVDRFVFASTCSNYGRMLDSDGFVDESSPLNPVSHYARLKVDFEQHLLDKKTIGFHPVCLRFSTAYGLTARPRFDLTVNEFTRELTLNRKLEIYGEQFWRPYCHANDLARACVAVLNSDPSRVDHRAINIGDSTENYQKKTLATLILDQLPDRADHVSYVRRDEDPRDYRVRFDLAKELLGFQITKTVPDGISEIVFAIRSGLIKNPDDPYYVND